MKSHLAALACGMLSVLAFQQPANAIDAANLQYELAYQLSGNTCSDTRDTRGIAVNAAETTLYLGYNNMVCGGEGQVHKADMGTQTVGAFQPHRGKCIVVDDLDRVYVAYGSEIRIYDANLGFLYTLPFPGNCEGLASKRESGTLALYASDKNANNVYRWELGESGANIVSHTLVGLDGDGILNLPAAAVRGIAIGPDGRILLANPGGDTIMRVNPDGTNLESFSFVEPYYLAVLGNQFVVSNGYSNTLSLVDYTTMQIDAVITPPWASLGIITPQNGYGNDSITGVVPTPAGNGFYFVLEHGDMLSGAGWEPVVKASAQQSAATIDLAGSFVLEQNYPNPFNPVTTLSYTLANTSPVRLVISDLLGRETAVLVNGLQAAGSHQVSFDASALSSGSYVYTLTNEGNKVSRKMLLLK